ncbi:MAG TPA: hypothetical protein VJN92_15600 [Candidatus Acidoferrum sp.]|nr:hypothetical protein [Candidatus Acidoferrum sp.]
MRVIKKVDLLSPVTFHGAFTLADRICDERLTALRACTAILVTTGNREFWVYENAEGILVAAETASDSRILITNAGFLAALKRRLEKNERYSNGL